MQMHTISRLPLLRSSQYFRTVVPQPFWLCGPAEGRRGGVWEYILFHLHKWSSICASETACAHARPPFVQPSSGPWLWGWGPLFYKDRCKLHIRLGRQASHSSGQTLSVGGHVFHSFAFPQGYYWQGNLFEKCSKEKSCPKAINLENYRRFQKRQVQGLWQDDIKSFFFYPKENYNGSSPHFPNGYLKMCCCIPPPNTFCTKAGCTEIKATSTENQNIAMIFHYDISLLLKHFRQSVWKTIHHNLKLGLSAAHCDCPLCSFLHLLSQYYS